MNRSTPGLPVRHQLPESTQTHVHRVGDAIQPSHPLSSPFPPALNLYQHQGLFQWSALCIRWPKYRSFNFNISPSSEHPGLISFRVDWLGARCREKLPRLGSQGRQMRGATPRSRKPPCQLIFLQKLSPLLGSCPTGSLHPPTTGKDASLLCPVRTLSALCRAQRPRQEPRGQMHFPMGLSQGRWF